MRPRGSVLILVIWTISSLSLLAATLSARCVSDLSRTQRLEGQLQARYIARAGISRAIQRLKADSTPTEWFDQQKFGDGVYSISGFRDEERAIPLNQASAEILTRLFLQSGLLKEADAQALADAIIDWRDEDQEKGPYGAEDFYYLGLDHPYECKDAPFENLEELLLVRGMTPELFTWAAPSLTVRGSGRVNLNTAGPTVLRALGLSESGVNGVVFYRSGEDNIPGTADDRVFSSPAQAVSELSKLCPVEDLNRLAQLDRQQMLCAASREFELWVLAQTAEQEETQAHIRCVVDRTGQVKEWQEW